MAIAQGTVSFRQILAEAAQEIGYKPTGNTGWQAALDKIAKPAGLVATGNGMVQRNPAQPKRPAPMQPKAVPLAQRFTDQGGPGGGKPALPLSIQYAKAAAKGR